MNKIIGYFYKGIGKFFDFIFSGLIFVVNILLSIFSSIRQALMAILSIGGCFIIFLFINPFFFYYLLKRPILLILIIFSFLAPILGTISLTYLQYVHYMVTEYFYDRADYYLLGRKRAYDKMGSYGQKYWQKLEQERLREQERRRKAQEEAWNQRFENFERGGFHFEFYNFEDFFNQNFENQSGSFGGQNNASGQAFGQDFIRSYEDACDTLQVTYDADKYAIKLAYRKMAKKYHPDLNKEAGAKEMFQKVGAAYEFLNDSNIERYKNIKGRS